MPTHTQIRGTFPAGALAAARTQHADLREQERQGRLMRDAQVADNCTSQHHIEATFGGTGTGPMSTTVDFGRLAFTAEPVLSCGSKRLGLDDDPAGDFDPATHFVAPIVAQVLKYTSDSRGFISGALVLIWAIGTVPDGYRVDAHLTFTGPAIRRGATT